MVEQFFFSKRPGRTILHFPSIGKPGKAILHFTFIKSPGIAILPHSPTTALQVAILGRGALQVGLPQTGWNIVKRIIFDSKNS